MTRLFFIVAILVSALCDGVVRAGTQVIVTQEHNNPSRDGVYIDSAFTPSAAANLTRDLGLQRHNLRQRLRPTAVNRRRPRAGR